MKNYKDLVCEEITDEAVSKEEVVEALNELSELVDSDTEEELVNLILSLVKMDMIDERAYSGIYDALDEIEEIEREDQQDDDDEIAEESQKPLYKRKGYVKCPNGKIRKRGKCGKPVDKKKSRTMRIARKKNKQAYKKGQRKTKITKRRLGQSK